MPKHSGTSKGYRLLSREAAYVMTQAQAWSSWTVVLCYAILYRHSISERGSIYASRIEFPRKQGGSEKAFGVVYGNLVSYQFFSTNFLQVREFPLRCYAVIQGTGLHSAAQHLLAIRVLESKSKSCMPLS